MSDVFISYARSTAARARDAASALGALGYTVWRDEDLPSHRTYADVIEEQLGTAKAVLGHLVGRGGPLAMGPVGG
jgi:adenylate cyclase